MSKKRSPLGKIYAGLPTAYNEGGHINGYQQFSAHKMELHDTRIVFVPKYRRQIYKANACPDHIHMLISIPRKLSVSQFMEYLKEKISLMIFDRNANLKYKYGNRKARVHRLLCRYGRLKQKVIDF